VEGDDTHKLAQIRHALVKQSVITSLKGEYEYESSWEEVVFHTEIRNTGAPEDILDLLQVVIDKVQRLALMLGGTVVLPPPGYDERIIAAHNWGIREEVHKRGMQTRDLHTMCHTISRISQYQQRSM
jgi:hypothetical protein